MGALYVNRYTELFLFHFDDKTRVLRWSMKGQDRGGVTGSEPKNGHREIGVLGGMLYSSTGSPLALIEALVLKHVKLKILKLIRKKYSAMIHIYKS